MEFTSIVEKSKEIEKETGRKLLSIEQTADYLGISENEVKELISENELKCTNSKFFKSIDIAKFELGEVDSDVTKTENASPANNTLVNSLTQDYNSSTLISDATEEEFEMVKVYGNGSCYFNEKRQCWQIAFYLEQDGKKKRKIISGANKSDIQYEFERIKRGDTELIPTIKANNKHLVTQVLDQLMIFKQNKKAATEEWYINLGKKIRDLLPKIYIEDMDAVAVQKFVTNLKYKENGTLYSSKTISETYKLFRMIYELAVDNEYNVQHINFKRITLPEGVKPNPHDKYFTNEQLQLIFQAVANNPKYNLIVKVLTGTSMRIGELLALQWDDINFEDKTISINRALAKKKKMQADGSNKIICEIGETKTAGSVREIDVPDEVLLLLKAWKMEIEANEKLMTKIHANGTEKFVIVDRYGHTQSYNHLQNNFRTHLGNHNIDFRATFHMFRHTGATLWFEIGGQMKDIQEYLGHSEIGTTSDIYVTMTRTARKNKAVQHMNMLNEVLRAE